MQFNAHRIRKEYRSSSSGRPLGDIMLRDAYGLSVRRATQDIDIAIRISDWSQYNSLTDTLVSTGDFKRVGVGHRFIFRATEPIDIVPFGEIAGQGKRIAWPPSEEFVMGVLGFDEAFRSAILVTLRQQPRLDVRVSTLAGLAVMKLISWSEAYPKRGKDGEDFYLIAASYIDAGNDERLYAEASDLRNVENFDRQVAGARLLGRDMSGLTDPVTHDAIRKVLERESDQNGSLKLVTDIVERT